LPKQPEAFSRVLIDQALKDSDWDLLNPRRVRFESSGRDGRADYVLLGQRGPLAVLEAKAEDKDPYEAKEQARGYAENLRAPFVSLSNGREHWFWNYARADQQDAYRIERLPSPKDLERRQGWGCKHAFSAATGGRSPTLATPHIAGVLCRCPWL